MENSEMITSAQANNLEMQLSDGGNTAYCSFAATDSAAKAMLFNGMNNPDHRVADQINQVIEVKDVYAEMVDIADEDTGEITQCPRIVLFDSKGESHVAVSVGLLSALKKLFKVFGQPSEWEKPLPLKVRQVNVKAGSMLTLELTKGK